MVIDTGWTRDQQLTYLTDLITRLTRGWTHREILDTGRIHAHRHPGLITQLRAALTGSTPPDGDNPRSIPDSRPPCPEEPLTVLLAIRAYTRGIKRSQALTEASEEDILRRITGIHPTLTDTDALDLTLTIDHLTRRAETALSWRLRSRTLRGHCPECGANGTITVHLDDHGPTDAHCTTCTTSWDAAHLGLLAGAMTPP